MTQKALNESIPASNPDALLLVGTSCPHCPAVIRIFGELVKAGELAAVEIINLEQRPEVVQSLQVRGVPWVRIGPFELEGVHTKAEYQQWITRAGEASGVRDYIEQLLIAGKVDKVVELIDKDSTSIRWLFELMRDPDAKMNLKLGIGVVMEEFASSEMFQPYIAELESLCQHEDARVRADACHYLALTGNDAVVPTLRSMLKDDDAEVREVSQDGLEQLGIELVS